MGSRTTSRSNVKRVYGCNRSATGKAVGQSKQFCQRQLFAVSTFLIAKEELKCPNIIFSSSTPPADFGLLLCIGHERFAIKIKEEFFPIALKKPISALDQLCSMIFPDMRMAIGTVDMHKLINGISTRPSAFSNGRGKFRRICAFQKN